MTKFKKMLRAYKQVKRRIDSIKANRFGDGHPVLEKDDCDISKLLHACESSVFGHVDEGVPEEAHLWVDGQDLGPVSQLDLQTLFAKATVAPFGHDAETKVDPEVRDAREIAASRIQLTLEGKPWFPILPLLPKLHVKEVKLYKLQLYGVGGHFKSHRDTLHGPDHMATAVVFLNGDFEDGELVVRKDGRRFEVAEGTCVFYTDCEHEVLRVTNGIRAVLQYDVYGSFNKDSELYEDHHVYSDVPLDGETPSDELKGLEAALEQYWEEDWATLSFILRHQYSQETIKVSQLRGFDGTLYHSLKALGYSPELHLCVVVQTDRRFEFQVIDADFNELKEWTDAAVTCFPISGDLIFHQAEAYTGNESVDALSMYHSACLCIRRVKRFKDAEAQTDQA